MSIQKNFATTMRTVMKEQHVTMEEFAQELGIARSSLQAYVKEASNPRADTIELISEKLGIPPEQLIADSQVQSEEEHFLFPHPARRISDLHPLLKPLAEAIYEVEMELFRLSETLPKMETEEKVRQK